MYRYYISLGILRKKEGRYYIHNPQYGEILDVLPKKVGKDSLHFYKVEYGNLGDHYYRFVPAGGSRVQLEKGWIISDTAKLESKLGYRVYIGEGSTPVDTLILDRDSCLYNY